MSQYERKAKSERKHIPFNSGASRAIPAPPVSRPGWKGPSYIKKAPKTSAASVHSITPAPNIQPHLLPVELQQQILNIFRDAFPISQDVEQLKPVLKDIKEALFEKDFGRAFGFGEGGDRGDEGEERREAYAVRWAPSRVLGYGSLVAWVLEECSEETWVKRFRDNGEAKQLLKVVCFGGGAAEIATFGALVRFSREKCRGKEYGDLGQAIGTLEISNPQVDETILKLHLIDTAPWNGVISKLHIGLITPPVLSKYASASARASNTSFLRPGAMNVSFTQADVLYMDTPAFKAIIGKEPAFITIFFTLNELYTYSIAKTTKFLFELSVSCPKDSLLCVIDSPGSYSETAIGNGEESKKYPIHWLMDHALLGDAKRKAKEKMDDENETDADEAGMWQKVMTDESRWYRLDESLKYPVSLENMRFQIHVFRRL